MRSKLAHVVVTDLLTFTCVKYGKRLANKNSKTHARFQYVCIIARVRNKRHFSFLRLVKWIKLMRTLGFMLEAYSALTIPILIILADAIPFMHMFPLALNFYYHHWDFKNKYHGTCILCLLNSTWFHEAFCWKLSFHSSVNLQSRFDPLNWYTMTDKNIHPAMKWKISIFSNYFALYRKHVHDFLSNRFRQCRAVLLSICKSEWRVVLAPPVVHFRFGINHMVETQ